jgi:hypothetical protein
MMQLYEARIGDYLIHDTDAACSGLVVGEDHIGPGNPPRPCVWLATESDGWLKVGSNEIGQYKKRIAELAG